MLCGRVLIDGPSVNLHHLIPRSYKGTETVRIHRICHAKIHSLFSEKELAQWYHTADRLHAHAEIQKYVAWVKKKDPQFFARHASGRRR